MNRFELPLIQGDYSAGEKAVYGFNVNQFIISPNIFLISLNTYKQLAPPFEEALFDIKEKHVLDGIHIFHNHRYTVVTYPLMTMDGKALLVEVDVYINGRNEWLTTFSIVLDMDTSFRSLRIADVVVVDEVVILAYYRDGFVKVGTGIEFGIYNMERDKYYPKVCNINNAKNYSSFRFIDEQHFTLRHWDKGIKWLGPAYDSGCTVEQYSFDVNAGKKIKVRRLSSKYYINEDSDFNLAWKKTIIPDNVEAYDSKCKCIQVFNTSDNSVVEELILDRFSLVGILNADELNLAMLYVKDIESELYNVWIFQRDNEWHLLEKYDELQVYDFNYDYESSVLVLRTISNTVIYEN